MKSNLYAIITRTGEISGLGIALGYKAGILPEGGTPGLNKLESDTVPGTGQAASSLTLDAALVHIRANLTPFARHETVATDNALSRVLSQDLFSSIDVPGHDNSSMDGYAVRFADLVPGHSLRVVGQAFAGHAHEAALGQGESVRIMTGGVIPAGADTVIMQEKAQRDGDLVRFEGTHRAGSNIRLRGEDIGTGDLLLPAGRLLRPADLGLLASVGIAEVRVQKRLRVAFFSTGDELCAIDQPLETGKIHDSNRHTLRAMLQHFGAEPIDLGIIPDQRPAIRQALNEASALADVVITSGGVSVGEADYVTELLAESGTVGFWKIAIKPGRPLAFGHLGKAVFFGLPGNPVSVIVTFSQVVRPALEHLQGMEPRPRLQLQARLLHKIRKTDQRREFMRGILSTTAEGMAQVRMTGNQSSGVLRSVSEANCFIVLPEGELELEAGMPVLVEPFNDVAGC